MLLLYLSPIHQLQFTIIFFNQCAAVFNPVTVVTINQPILLDNFWVMYMTTNNTVQP